MRMAGPDIVLFVVGLVLFGGATFTILNMPGGAGGAGSPLGFFSVTYATVEVDGGSEDVASLRSATATFDVNATDVVRLRFLVTCSGPGGDVGPVTFDLQLAIEGPAGQTAEESGSCTQGAEAILEIAAVPPATTARGATEVEARENLAAGDTSAVGAWTVTVSGARGGAPVGLPVGDPSGTIALTIEQAQPTFAPGTR